MTPPLPPLDLLKGVWQTQLSSYVWVSGFVVLTYDTISTFPREVTYIWRGKSSLPTTLYLLLRYWGLFQAMICTVVYSTVQSSVKRSHCTHSFALVYPLNLLSFQLVRCHLFFGFVAAVGSNTSLLLFVNGILCLRLHALYGRDVRVLCFLSLLFTGEFVVQVYVGVKIGISTIKATFVPPPGVPVLGCLTAPPDISGVKIAWIVSIIVAVICFIMTLVKFVDSARQISPRSGRRIRFSPLAETFVRDGTVYFLAVVVTLVAGAITSSIFDGPLVLLYEPWMAVSLIVAGSRLVLNLREAAVRDVSGSRLPSFIRGMETSASNGPEFQTK